MRGNAIAFPLFRGRSQGWGRTAGLPIFRTPVLRSYSIGTVLACRKIHAVIGGRRWTNAESVNNVGSADGSPLIKDRRRYIAQISDVRSAISAASGAKPFSSVHVGEHGFRFANELSA